MRSMLLPQNGGTDGIVTFRRSSRVQVQSIIGGVPQVTWGYAWYRSLSRFEQQSEGELCESRLSVYRFGVSEMPIKGGKNFTPDIYRSGRST